MQDGGRRPGWWTLRAGLTDSSKANYSMGSAATVRTLRPTWTSALKLARNLEWSR